MRGGKRAPEDDRPVNPNIVVGGPPGWQVRVIHPENAVKEYVCPGCSQEIRPGTAHVVAWQPDHEHDRRHWHPGCWQTFVRQGGRFSTGER
ncbi:MAG TPA: hypothetical protein VGB52_10515 [Actinomycetota bacterium]|jgi:hypothetical protein